MNSRDTLIARSILNYLHDLDGGQAHALTIHAGIGGLTACSTAEFDSVMKELDAKRLVIRLKTKFKGEMWNISDAGEAARLEM